MNPALMAAVFAPRVLQSRTYTANTTVIIPPTMTQLETVVGQGAPGGGSGILTAVNVFFVGSGSGASPAANDWSNVQPAVASAVSAVNAGGSGSYTALTLFKYADGTEDLTGATVSFSGAQAGTAAASFDPGWHTSGPITASGAAVVAYQRANGDPATGFGQSFPGGVGGVATPVSLTNVAVTPGASYALVIPAGASISITYYD